MTEQIVGKIGVHPDRPERLALIAPDGRVRNWFACDATREDVERILIKAGLVLLEDGTVMYQ